MISHLRLLPARLLIAIVQCYRLLLSPWLGSACRFEPTCSAYSLQALQQHGAMAGTYLTLHRLVRCHPMCQGGRDPVPQEVRRPFFAFSSGAAVRAPRVPSSIAKKTHP